VSYNLRILRLDTIAAAKREMQRIGCDTAGIEIMAPKAIHRIIKLENVNVKAANLLKQTMLSKGGEAAVTRGVADFSTEYSDVLLIGTLRQFRAVIGRLSQQPWGLPSIARELRLVLEENSQCIRTYHWEGKKLEIGSRTVIMGILNVTPDSFSDGGKFNSFDAALLQAHQMVEDGADIIDIGGESTRPYGNNRPINAAEEMERVLPVLERLLKELPVPISLDTYKAATARAALQMGVHIINDVWGLQKDPDMGEVVAEYGVPLIVMHNQAEPGYQDIMGEINGFLRRSIELAEQAGIAHENIMVDPGIGFGKTRADNLVVMRRLREMEALGCPILLGTSRKAFIGTTLNLPATDRVEGTAATIALGIANGVDIIRVHDVKAMTRVARMADALVREEVE
jgi:dihydropteroate synthase